MGQLTTVKHQTGQLIQWSPPCLSEKLSALLDSRQSYQDMPVVGPKTAAELRAYIAHNPAPLADDEQIEEVLGLLANVTKDGKVTAQEAEARMSQYCRGLRGITRPALNFAYDKILRTSTFFPSIPEIIAAAAGSPSDRYASRRNVATALLLKHRNEWRDPVEVIEPADMAGLTETMASVTDTLRAPIADTAPPRLKRQYCQTCYFDLDNPMVATCDAPNCGRPGKVEAA